MAKCDASNGSYVCQYDEIAPHKGMHYAYFVSAGRPYLATWLDRYSAVKTQKAPVPKLPPR